MSWLHKLHETYEICSQNRDFTEPPQADGEKETPALMPVSHTSQQAQICITLDAEGKFKGAELLPPKKQIVIPATEESAGRAGAKVAPHPLIDKVHYIASDYQGRKASVFKGAVDAYKEQLGKWANSEFTHPIVLSVFAYVSKGQVVHDLVKHGFLFADADKNLLTQPPVGNTKSIFNYISADPKTKQYDQGDAMICWRILGEDLQNSWNHKELQQCWICFDAANMCEKSLCMVSADTVSITKNHPRNIRRPGDGAKLISSNDDSGFTFRGRFLTAAEASTVGYEVSHKAHNALRWLIARQGYRHGEQAVLAWAVNGVEPPNPVTWAPPEEPDFSSDAEDDAPDLTVFFEAPVDPEAPVASEETSHRDMGQAFANRLKKALRGYRKQFGKADGIAVLALDAASPGRLSVTFYREQIAGEYLDRLEKWQQDASWLLPLRVNSEEGTGPKAKPHTVFIPYAPLPRTIAETAYGRRIDDKLLKATVERLLPCIVDDAPIPPDLMESCVRRACNRVGLEDWEWPGVLGTACALYKGFYARHPQKEERRTYTMSLDKERRTRDYLYGRLLATAEYIERSALNAAGEKRPTNAERLMQRFADHPSATWRDLEMHFAPYMQRLQSREDSFWIYDRAKRMLQEINNAVESIDDFISTRRLEGEFLLGYHCQYADFYKKSEKNNAAPANKEGE